MQVSDCGGYVTYSQFDSDDWQFKHSTDIAWQPSLSEMLREEKTLWGNLKKCEGCNAYKTEKAYERCAFEEEIFIKFRKDIDAFEREDVEWYENQCRRCRVKRLLVILERSEEIFDEPKICQEESIGLKREWKNEGDKRKALDGASCYEEWYATRLDYEPWKYVFKRLCI
jgi:hypothetical protein